MTTTCPNGHTDVYLDSNKVINGDVARSIRWHPSATSLATIKKLEETEDYEALAKYAGTTVDRKAYELFNVCRVCGVRFLDADAGTRATGGEA